MKPKTSGDAGFTLLEVLIAMFVIGLIVQATGVFQQATLTGTRTNGNLLAATRLIGSSVEQTRADILYAPGFYWPPRDTTIVDPSTRISLKRTVTKTMNKRGAYCDSIRELAYTAKWNAGPRNDSMTLTTFVSYEF